MPTSKIPNSVGRNDNFLARARKLSILPTSLDIFDIRQKHIRILYINKFLSMQMGQTGNIYLSNYTIYQDSSSLLPLSDLRCSVWCLKQHIYFTSIEKQILTTYTSLSRFSVS